MKAGALVRIAAAAFVALGSALVTLAQPGRGSDGTSEPLVADGYVFPGADPNRVVFAFTVTPRFGNVATHALTFDPDIVYEIAVDNVGDGRAHLVMQFKAEGAGPLQRIAMYGPAVPTGGRESTLAARLGTAPYNQTTLLGDDVTFYAGPRRDPLHFDAARFAEIVAGRASCFRPAGTAVNAYTKANLLAIVAEVPKTLVAPRKLGRVGVWFDASVPDRSALGYYRQVSRTGRPLVRELVENADDHERFVSTQVPPDQDPGFAGAVSRYAAASPPAGAWRSPPLAAAAAKLFGLDELQADVEAPGPAGYLDIETATPTPAPAFTPGKNHRVPGPYRPFGGRAPGDGVGGTLAAFYGDELPRALLAPEDGRETPCLATDNTTPPPNPSASSFPYLDSPF